MAKKPANKKIAAKKSAAKKPAGKKSAPAKKPAKAAPGKSAPSRAEDEAKILSFLKKHPGSNAESVREATGLPPERTSYVLLQLARTNKIQGEGTTRARAYTVAATQPAPSAAAK